MTPDTGRGVGSRHELCLKPRGLLLFLGQLFPQIFQQTGFLFL
jgi:hypothetical protein